MRVNVLNNRILTCVVSCVVALAVSPVWLQARPLGAQGQPPAPEQPQPAQLSPQQLQEMVAPIALYPDALVAQILAASAYPTQIVEAERLLQQNPNLQGAALGAEVDKQDWDPSVKALTQFPSVLADMDKNLAWTSALGDANYNQSADVMDAIQVLREKAAQAGNLKSTPQQTVTTQGSTVVIQPANPQIVYVPDYDPELVYGYPIGLWPGFYPWWGVSGPYLSFGIGFGIGPFFGFGWGWHAWGFNWGHGGGLMYGGGRYAFHSHAFYDRNAYVHGNYRGAAPFARGDRGLRGYSTPAGRSAAPSGQFGARSAPSGQFGTRSVAPSAQSATRSIAPSAQSGARSAPSGQFGTRSVAPSAQSGTRSGAIGGVTHGGDTRTFSSRGQSSMGGGTRGGGGGGTHGGGGSSGARGGGGHR
jgi:uncharacterized membrane protein YgcG